MPGDRVWIEGGDSHVGTDRPEHAGDGESPRRAVCLSSYAIETEAVTVARFANFVAATDYRTEAERFGWSSVFVGGLEPPPPEQVTLPQTPWWRRVEGASWDHPEGPGSTVTGRLDHPVTQISWTDARDFAAWAGGRLPTEAEWEHAARGGNESARFPWGDREPTETEPLCNIWQGHFPTLNTNNDGYARTAPARSFAPNPYGLYNMAGNVWEWTNDAFRIHSLSPASQMRNKQATHFAEKVLKGGSFLCHISYCYRYRIAARMALSPDSSASNVGFRVAYDSENSRG